MRPTAKVSKTIILLSDGDETIQSFGPGFAYTVNQGEMNLVEMCTAIKARGVRLYPDFGSSISGATLNRLQTCASTSQFFYNPPDGQALADAFNDIGSRIGGHAMLINGRMRRSRLKVQRLRRTRETPNQWPRLRGLGTLGEPEPSLDHGVPSSCRIRRNIPRPLVILPPALILPFAVLQEFQQPFVITHTCQSIDCERMD